MTIHSLPAPPNFIKLIGLGLRLETLCSPQTSLKQERAARVFNDLSIVSGKVSSRSVLQLPPSAWNLELILQQNSNTENCSECVPKAYIVATSSGR